MTGEFPAQRASNAENVSIWWRHHAQFDYWCMVLNNISRHQHLQNRPIFSWVFFFSILPFWYNNQDNHSTISLSNISHPLFWCEHQNSCLKSFVTSIAEIYDPSHIQFSQRTDSHYVQKKFLLEIQSTQRVRETHRSVGEPSHHWFG